MKACLLNRPPLRPFGKQLPSFTSSAVPSVFMCYVSTRRRPISFPPCKTDLWPALACLRDAAVLQREAGPFFAVTQQERVLQCSTEVPIKSGWSYSVQSLRQLADILQSGSIRRLLHLYRIVCFILSTKSVGRQRKTAESLR